ncbi:MAG: hypothetical protein GY820_19665 [Gammaproteobacteria bacterium]|nr:hypothetical protein [Gammaproteobacteria bacterium]
MIATMQAEIRALHQEVEALKEMVVKQIDQRSAPTKVKHKGGKFPKLPRNAMKHSSIGESTEEEQIRRSVPSKVKSKGRKSPKMPENAVTHSGTRMSATSGTRMSATSGTRMSATSGTRMSATSGSRTSAVGKQIRRSASTKVESKGVNSLWLIWVHQCIPALE